MLKKLFVITLVLLLFPSALAASEITLKLLSPTQDDFSQFVITVKHGAEIEKALLEDSQYAIELETGQYELEVILNSFETPAPDLYGKKKFTVNNSINVDFPVFPIGYLQGSVLDTEGNLIPRAKLQFSCFSTASIEYPTKTDATGFFIVPNMPVGTCTIIASTSSAAGTKEVTITRGQAAEIEVVLEQKVAGGLRFLVILLILAIVGFILWFSFSRKSLLHKGVRPPVKPASPKETETKPTTVSKQTKALLETLSEKEKNIVSFLLESKHKSSQARIRHATRTPRTTLTRILQGLEKKKMVQIEKTGKMVSVELTKFFLGKE